MQRKMQVFVSSTYADLIEERQAAVQAILKASHIPAGMELFTAGDGSQLEVIKQWIEESDVFMLILGGRYGSIEPISNLSYTQVEYEYAALLKKPMFAVVMHDELRQQKVKEHGEAVLERKYVERYDSFKESVLSRMSSFFRNSQDIKLAVHESLPTLIKRIPQGGWVRASALPDITTMTAEISRLSAENASLRSKASRAAAADSYNGFDFETTCEVLRNQKITVPKGASGSEEDIETTVLRAVLAAREIFTTGASNDYGMTDFQKWVFFKLAPHLAPFGLVEKTKVRGAIQRIQWSKDGYRFLAAMKVANPPTGDTSPVSKERERQPRQTKTKSVKKKQPAS